MIPLKWLLQAAAVTALIIGVSVPAQQDKPSTPERPNAHATTEHPTRPATKNSTQDDGNQVFQQHCSRCHTAPDGFSSRISGTVALHMRVRASLSEREMQALLRFLNP